MSESESQSEIGKIRSNHPFPWRHAVLPSGEIKVIDGRGAEIPIFALIGLVEALTLHMASKAQ